MLSSCLEFALQPVLLTSLNVAQKEMYFSTPAVPLALTLCFESTD